MSAILFSGLGNKSVTVVGAGPAALGVALELKRSGVKDLQIVSRDIARDERSARNITGGNAAGSGAPFATKDKEILDCARLSLPDWRLLAESAECQSVAAIKARTVTSDPDTIAFLSSNPDFLRGPDQLGIPECYEVSTFAFNPRSVLTDWVRQLVESGCELRTENVTREQWLALQDGKNPFGTDIAVVCCGSGHNQLQPGMIVPVRGVLAHIRNVPLDLSRVPVSAMYEDDLTKLVYLIPRPGSNGTWDLIVGGTFDMGEGECTEEYKQQVKNDRLVSARGLFAKVVPELIPFLDRHIDEISVGYRPRGVNGAPIEEHFRADRNDVFVFNGMSGQGWATVPERSRRLLDFIRSKI